MWLGSHGKELYPHFNSIYGGVSVLPKRGIEAWTEVMTVPEKSELSCSRN